MHNEGLHGLNCPKSVTSIRKSRNNRQGKHAAYMGALRNAYQIFFGKDK
jgi:hypothetical protein